MNQYSPAATGTLAAMEERLANAKAIDLRNIGGYDSSTAASMMYLQAQAASFTQRVA